MYLFKTDHALVNPLWGHFCPQSSIWSTFNIWAVTCDFQQCGILTSVDSEEPLQPSFKLRNSKWCSVSSLTLKEYSSDKQRLWSDCAYAQADLRLCWSHIPHCWRFHALAHMVHPLGDIRDLDLYWWFQTREFVCFNLLVNVNSVTSWMRPFWPHYHNLSKLGCVPVGDVTYQISKLWSILFSGMNLLLMFSLNNLLIEEKSGKLFFAQLKWNLSLPVK